VDTLLPFAGVATLIVVSPGPDLMLVTRSVLAGGRHAGLLTAAGIALGSTMWAMAAVAGLATLLSASPDLLTIIRWLGAGYLAWIGVRTLRSARTATIRAQGESMRVDQSWTGPFQTGLISNALHPGQIIFYTSILPQFIDPARDPTRQAIVLGAVFAAIVLTWFSTYAVLVSKLRMQLWNRLAPRLTLVAGAVLIGLAARLVVRL